MSTLARFASDISDEFQAEFLVVGDNMLVSTLSTEDLPKVNNIIKKHIPNARVKFEKSGNTREDRDIYIIRLDQNRFDL